jgi:phosphoglycerate dehydrogenase-like enzyme
MKVLISIQQSVPQWQIPPGCVGVLRQRFPDVDFVYATRQPERDDGLRHCDIAFTWILNEAELGTAAHLKWVHTSAVAVETLCLPQLFERGIVVSNTRGVQAVPIAEHVLAVVLALAKQIPFTVDNQRKAIWGQLAYVGERQPWLLAGRTLGLIGMGTIGAAVAARASAFGMRVVALRRRAGAAEAPHVELMTDLDALLAAADVLVIAAPLTSATEGMIGAPQIARLRRGSLLVNVGRARILDTAALVAALDSGHLGGASLDVYPIEPLPPDHPLWACPNTILTPHTAGFRQGHWDDAIDVFSENLRRWRLGEDLLFRVRPDLGY